MNAQISPHPTSFISQSICIYVPLFDSVETDRKQGGEREEHDRQQGSPGKFEPGCIEIM